MMECAEGTARAPDCRGLVGWNWGGGRRRYGWTEVLLDVYYYQGWFEGWVGHCGGCGIGVVVMCGLMVGSGL